MPRTNKVRKTKQHKRRRYPTEAQAKYLLDMKEAKRMREIFADD